MDFKRLISAGICYGIMTVVLVWHVPAFAISVDVARHRIEQAKKEQRWEDVIRNADAIIRIKAPYDEVPVDVLVEKASALLFLEQPGDALDSAEMALSVEPRNLAAFMVKGRAYVMLRQLATAVDVYKKALDANPQAWEPAHMLASISQMQGDFGQAIDWYEKVVTNNPDNPELWTEYALLLHSNGVSRRALSAADRAVELAPANPAYLNNRGMIQLSLNNVKGAKADFSAALKAVPGHQEAMLNYANVLRSGGLLAESLALLEGAVKRYPDFVRAYVGKMYTLSAMGEYQSALVEIRNAYNLAPADPYVLNEYAWFLATSPEDSVRNGILAVQLAKECTLYEPAPVPGHYDTLAAAYAEAGDFEKAMEAEQQAIRLGLSSGLPESVLQRWQNRLLDYQMHIPFRVKAAAL